ncbi:MAG TPA: DNA topoisomerase IB [Cytophagales bacterium]|nr:DNA topoisomerase IB [Cytophagales bacterium]
MQIAEQVLEERPEVIYAEEIGLRYISDSNRKGITRRAIRGSFKYYDPKGIEIADEKTLQRIKSLKIPPAWENVWISPIIKGHLQVTGVDAKGRKQYLYHPEWSQYRCETKFDKMYDFGEVLPKIRRQIEEDLNTNKLNKQKVLATVVGLLDSTLIRIGNKVYEKENKSFGLTTLKDRHMKALGKNVMFEFVGKKGVKQSIKVTDSKLARVVKKCRDIPGYQLFQYYDEEGNKLAINSEDVNGYLKATTGGEITAKDFRTWGASAYAVKLVETLEYPETQKELKKNVNTVIKDVAHKLGNTVTVCKKHYLHPIVIKAYEDNYISELIKNNPRIHLTGSKLLTREEKIFMKILEKLK